MMQSSRGALLLSMTSTPLIPTKYIQELPSVITEPPLVNAENREAERGRGGWNRGNVAQV